MSSLYIQAAKALEPSLNIRTVKNKKFVVSLKNRTLHASVKNKPMTHKLVCETLKNMELIEYVLASSIIEEEFSNVALLFIMAYELLLGAKKIRGGGRIKRMLMDNLDKMKQAMITYEEKFGGKTSSSNVNNNNNNKYMNDSDGKMNKTRYARVNGFKVDVTNRNEIENILARFEGAKLDEDIPYVLRFSDSTASTLFNHELVLNGTLILQDKASCFPIHAVELELKRRNLLSIDCIDACAAPGNKTTQLASVLSKQRNNKVFAFDRSKNRAELLQTRVNEAGAGDVVVVTHRDFLKITPENYPTVKCIVLDPSCSGSGLPFDLEKSLENISEKEKMDRAKKLAQVQVKLLTHALTFSPQVELVSYSTCSIYEVENEMVVNQVLSENEEWETVCAFPEWRRRGNVIPNSLINAAVAKNLVRVSREEDDTGGFFVALFGRRMKKKSKIIT